MFDLFINYCKANPALTIVLIALAVFLIVVCCVIIVLSAKAKKAKRRLEQAKVTEVLDKSKEIEETPSETQEDEISDEPIEHSGPIEDTEWQEDEEEEKDERSVRRVLIDTYYDDLLVDDSEEEETEESQPETVETNETPVEVVTEEIAGEPAEEIKEESVDTVEAVEESTQTVEEFAEEPAPLPDEESIEEPVAEPIVETIVESVEETVEEPVTEVSEKTEVVETSAPTEEKVEVSESAPVEETPKTEPTSPAQTTPAEIPVTVTHTAPAPQPAPIAPQNVAKTVQPQAQPRPQATPVKQAQAAPPASHEEKPLTAEERKELLRQQLVDKIVERLGYKPAQNKPAAQPTTAESKPTEEKPVETKPAESKPVEEKPLTGDPIQDLKLIRPEDEINDDEMQIDLFDDPNFFTNGPKALLDELKDVDTSLDFYEEDETDLQARHRGKWVIFRVISEDKAPSKEELYFFELHAANDDKLFSSEEYPNYNAALRAIETHKANILRDNFKIVQNKKGEYIFKLLSGKNLLLCVSDGYETKEECEKTVKRMRRFARMAIVDENLQDHIVKVPYEDMRELPVPDGEGKWIVDATENEEGELTYFFGLYAPGGEKLLSGEDYTTYIGAINGIQTFKSNVASGNFRITLTKRGDYVYKLLNRNGQILYLGEHYRTRQVCATVVEAIKRFVKNAPVLTDQKLVEEIENS